MKGHKEDVTELLGAYLDGELPEGERAQVDAYLKRHPEFLELLSALQETRSLLQALPRREAPAGFAERVLAAAEREALLAPEPKRSFARRRRWGPWPAAAAIVFVVAGAGAFIFWQSSRMDRELAFKNANVRMLENTASKPQSRALADASQPKDREALHYSTQNETKAPGVSAPKTELPRENKADSTADLLANELRKEVTSAEDQGPYADFRKIPSEVGQQATRLPAEREIAGASRAVQSGAKETQDRVALDMPARAGRIAESSTGMTQYDFTRKKIELQFSFKSAEQLEQFEHDLRDYFVSSRVTEASRELEAGGLASRIYLPGIPGVNYRGDDSRQFLVSAPPRVMDGIIGLFEKVEQQPDPSAVGLRVVDTTFTGLHKTRAAANVLGTPDGRMVLLGEQTDDKLDVDRVASRGQSLRDDRPQARGRIVEREPNEAAMDESVGREANFDAVSDAVNSPSSPDDSPEASGWTIEEDNRTAGNGPVVVRKDPPAGRDPIRSSTEEPVKTAGEDRDRKPVLGLAPGRSGGDRAAVHDQDLDAASQRFARTMPYRARRGFNIEIPISLTDGRSNHEEQAPRENVTFILKLQTKVSQPVQD